MLHLPRLYPDLCGRPKFVRDEPLLVATTVDRVAIFARVAIVPDARLARMALACLDRHKPFAAVGGPLEPDGGERFRCQKAAEHQSQSDESLLHNDIPMFFLKPVSANDTGYAKARRIASVDRTAYYFACHSPVMIPCQGRVGVFVSVGALFFWDGRTRDR